MPRLDNQNQEVIEFYELRPGSNKPIDICKGCYSGWWHMEIADHPPYQEKKTKCAECGERLTIGDNDGYNA